jgi:pilus assembly protein TadC
MSARLALGVDPVEEWGRLRADPTLASLARTMLRSLESGAPLASGLQRLAIDRRRELRTAGQVKARRVGVSTAAPLGLCFLPAFMLIGVVPTVVGTFSDLVLH